MSVNVDIDGAVLDRLPDAHRQYGRIDPARQSQNSEVQNHRVVEYVYEHDHEHDAKSRPGSGSKLYIQYADPAYRRCAYVAQGFSWYGLFFGAAWLIYHGMRGLLAVAILSLTLCLGFIVFASIIWTGITPTDAGVIVPFVALLFAHVIIGLQGSQWRLTDYRNRGWKEIQTISARSLDEAEQFGEIALYRFKSQRRDDLTISDEFPPRSRDPRPPEHAEGSRIDASKDPNTIAWTDAGVDFAQREAEVAMVGEEYREFVRTAQRELQKGKVHKAIWARAFATYADDVASVRRRYICLRAESLAEVSHSHRLPGDTDDQSNQNYSRVPVVHDHKGLSAEEIDTADRQIDEFVEEVVDLRRFDRYSTDLVGSTLANYLQLPDTELSHRLHTIGLRLDVLSGPGSRNKPEFTEYRIVAESGDLLHLPDRGWFGLFLEKLYERSRDANIVLSHAYVHGNSITSRSGSDKTVRAVDGTQARDYFFRYMEEDGDDNFDVFQRSLDGPDIDVKELWEREASKSIVQTDEQNVERDSYSMDWVKGQDTPNRAERLRQQRRVTNANTSSNYATGEKALYPYRPYDEPETEEPEKNSQSETGKRLKMRLTDRRTHQITKKPGANLRHTRETSQQKPRQRTFINEEDREFLTSLVRDEDSKRIGIFRDSNR